MKVEYFESPEEFTRWLEKNQARATEVWVGFRKKGSGLPGISYQEAVDQALSFGWIDGTVRGVDQTSYASRFTPRRPESNWSATNVKRVGELKKLGLMREPGLGAFEARGRRSTSRRKSE